MKHLLASIFLLINIFIQIDSSRISPNNYVYGYFEKIGIPEAERIRKIEEENEESLLRIAGGDEAELGQVVYQAGLLVSILELENVTGLCGGCLVSADRVITAAHCWFDGVNHGYSITVVLGSTIIFTGGTRIVTAVVKIHPKWTPETTRNDMAIIYLPDKVKFTNASISQPPILNQLNLTVISNDDCNKVFNGAIQDNHICTIGPERSNICSGDSGGPLVTVGVEKISILIGVTSFGSSRGCEANRPAGFSRVTSFSYFIQNHLNSD